MLRINVLAFLLIAPAASFAATYTAASCSRADVNAVINGPTHIAVDGDVIEIPAGSCTWTTDVTIPSGIGITVKGSGTPNSSTSTFGASASCAATLITDNSPSGVFRFRPGITSSLSRISCMKFRTDDVTQTIKITPPLSVGGQCNSSTCSMTRIDNIIFDETMQKVFYSSGSQVSTDNVFGVLDHNSMAYTTATTGMLFSNYHNSAWEGVGAYGDNSRSSADTFGTNKAIYLENNSFGLGAVVSETEGSVPYGGQGGGRIVVRFNDMPGAIVGLSNHGTDSNGRPRGPTQGEFYGNTLNCTRSGACQAVGARSGTYMVFGNSLTGNATGYYNSYVDLATSRVSAVWSTPWNQCNGSGPYDNNSVTPRLCIDQPSRSGGTLLSGSPTPTPTGWPNQVLNPTYEWNNSGKAASFGNVTSNPGGHLSVNVDWYSDGSNGSPVPLTTPGTTLSTGVKFGTLANRPTSCTTGVGYYATDQGNWNTSGNSFGQGQLYKCTSTNTWTLSYTPYTYPHPLIANEGGGGSPTYSHSHTGGRATGGRQ